MPRGLWARILTSSLLGWGWRAHAYGIKRKVASCELLMSPLGSKQCRWFHFAFHLVAGCVGGRCGRRDKFKFHYNVCLVVWWFNFYWHDFLATRSPVQSLDSARLSFLFHYTSPTREREKKNYEFCTCSMRGRRLEVKPQNFYKCDSRSHSRINLLKKFVAFLRLLYVSSSYNLSNRVVFVVCTSRIDKFSKTRNSFRVHNKSSHIQNVYDISRNSFWFTIADYVWEKSELRSFHTRKSFVCYSALALANVAGKSSSTFHRIQFT